MQVSDDCNGVARFDGQILTRHLRGQCFDAMDIAPDGSVWLLAGVDYHSGDEPGGIAQVYVTTPEAVAGTE